MFCKNCGAEIQEGISFCANCGSQIENVNMPANDSPKKKNKIIGIIASVVVIAIVASGLIAIIGAIFGDDYESVARKYALAEAEFDYEKAMKYVAFDTEKMLDDYFEYMCDLTGYSLKEFYETLEDEYDVSIKNMDDVLECARVAELEDREEDFGKYTVSVDVVDSKEISDSRLKRYVENYDYLSSDFLDVDDYLNIDKIKKGYEVEVEIEIDGEDDYESYTNKYVVVKYKGKWKVLETAIPDL